jgi:hypothetical protein
VSNVSLTYPTDGDSLPKGWVIPGDIFWSHDRNLIGRKALLDRAILHQLVGEVTAHQGNDA